MSETLIGYARCSTEPVGRVDHGDQAPPAAAGRRDLQNTERLALAGFLAGYSGLTRLAYELDLRQYAGWCQQHHLRLFQARRADIECFARDLEARGRARATLTRRLCTIAGSCRYAVEEELLDHSPAAHARRPRPNRHAHVERRGTIGS